MDLPRYCFAFVTLALVFSLSGSAFAEEDAVEKPTFENVEHHRIESDFGVVAADHRYASEAGAEILQSGGNAADAGVVAMLVLGITNPFSSGLGGGGFCLYHENDRDTTTVLDFRETAPAAAHRDMYIVGGEARPDLARRGGLAVATPGEPAGIWSLHGRFGKLAWEELVDSPRRLAEQGFPVGSTLREVLERHGDELREFPELAAVFQNDDGEFLKEGRLLVRDDLVNALTILRDEGVRPFYVGEIADAIAATTRRHYGVMTGQDLANYALKRREPIVSQFEDHEIHSMPPPSSGGIALAQAFNILEQFEAADSLDDPAYLHLVIEALKHAFADRAHWLGDTDFVEVPVERLTSDEYAAELAQRIEPDAVLATDDYGTTAPDEQGSGTSHFSVVDSDENMLACTTTINTRFGSMVYVPDYGIILNNEMADFNIEPGEPNIFGLIGNEQNAVAANKRPLSSMSPTLVLKDGRPTMTLGASGGPMIISGTYFAILHSLGFEADPLDAVLAPRIHHQWMPESLFVEFDEFPLADELRAFGHDLEARRAYNAVQLIMRRGDRWIGVSDPRKGGTPAASKPSPESQ